MMDESAPSTSSIPCSTCRRRKVRCDKGRPCLNCKKAGQLCSYQDDGLVSVISDASTNPAELQARISELEKVVEDLRRQIRVDGRAASSPLENSQIYHGSPGTQIFTPDSSMHFSCIFWGAMTKEVDDMIGLLNDWGCNDTLSLSDASTVVSGLGLPQHDISSFIPAYDVSEKLLQHFFGSINPFIKIIHETYFRKELSKYRQGRLSLSNEFECLYLSIHALSIMTVKDEDVEGIFSERNPAVVERFHTAVKRALARAQFMRTNKILVLQALLLYLTFLYLRGLYQDANAILALCTRVTQHMGLQRDPAGYAYSPWISDMRRRVWLYLSILDGYAMVTYGCESCLPIATTRQPRNVNEDLWNATRFAKPSSLPEETVGFTNISVVLIRGRLAELQREIAGNLKANLSMEGFQENELSIARSKASIERDFLAHIHRDNPLCMMAYALMEGVISTLRLSIRQHQNAYGNSQRTEENQHSLFVSAVKILEVFLYHHTVFAEHNTDWVMKMTVPFLPLMIVLSYLARKTLQPSQLDAAWSAVELVLKLYGQCGPTANMDVSPMWAVIRQLHQQASALPTAPSPQPGTTLGIPEDWMEMQDLDDFINNNIMFDTFPQGVISELETLEDIYAEGSCRIGRI